MLGFLFRKYAADTPDVMAWLQSFLQNPEALQAILQQTGITLPNPRAGQGTGSDQANYRDTVGNLYHVADGQAFRVIPRANGQITYRPVSPGSRLGQALLSGTQPGRFTRIEDSTEFDRRLGERRSRLSGNAVMPVTSPWERPADAAANATPEERSAAAARQVAWDQAMNSSNQLLTGAAERISGNASISGPRIEGVVRQTGNAVDPRVIQHTIVDRDPSGRGNTYYVTAADGTRRPLNAKEIWYYRNWWQRDAQGNVVTDDQGRPQPGESQIHAQRLQSRRPSADMVAMSGGEEGLARNQQTFSGPPPAAPIQTARTYPGWMPEDPAKRQAELEQTMGNENWAGWQRSRFNPDNMDSDGPAAGRLYNHPTPPATTAPLSTPSVTARPTDPTGRWRRGIRR